MNTRVFVLPLLLAAAPSAQSIDVWNTGAWSTGAIFNGVSISGPAGIGVLAASFVPVHPPLPTPFGPLWLGDPVLVLDAGIVPAGGSFATYITLPTGPGVTGTLLAFQGAVLPSAAPGTLLFSSACTRRIGPLPTVGPLTPYAGELFGRSIDAGDRDGDGVAELAVGAPGAWNATGTVSGVGGVGIYAGSPLVLVQTLSGTQGSANFGNSVAMAQVDGASGLDLIVGEPSYDLSPTVTNSGRVHVFYAPGYTTSSVVSYGPPAGGSLQYFGFEVLGVDFTGSGTGPASVVVGAPALGSTPSRVHVYSYGAGGVLALGYSLTNPTGLSGEYGRALAAGNVITGTAAVELIVGDRSYAPPTGTGHGRVYVHAGGLLVASLDSPTPTDNGFFGSALATGDFTGDGVADLAVGAPGECKVYLYAGGTAGLASTPLVLGYPGPALVTSFGTALRAGDADGDGALDLVVGRLGEAIVFRGTPGSANSFQFRSHVADDDPLTTLYGTSFAIGDTDGDTVPELFGGAPLKTVGFLTPGLVLQGRL